MGYLSCQFMNGQGGDQAYDAVRNAFGDLGKSYFGRDFQFSELIQPSGHRDQDLFISKTIKRPAMDAVVQRFIGPQKTTPFFKKSYGFFSRRFHSA